MKENSIEEDINRCNKLTANWIGLSNQLALKRILLDYRRVLKENEELLQEKIDNQKINLLAQNFMLDYQKGYEDGKANRGSAVQIIIDNQQYHIFRNQIEKYKEHIEKLQKENEELKNEVMEKDLEIIGKEEYTKASMKVIIEQYYTANEECISKRRIESIIDRIDYDIKKNKEIISKNTNIYATFRKNDYQIVRLRAMNTKSLDIKKRLQELLEKE